MADEYNGMDFTTTFRAEDEVSPVVKQIYKNLENLLNLKTSKFTSEWKKADEALRGSLNDLLKMTETDTQAASKMFEAYEKLVNSLPTMDFERLTGADKATRILQGLNQNTERMIKSNAEALKSVISEIASGPKQTENSAGQLLSAFTSMAETQEQLAKDARESAEAAEREAQARERAAEAAIEERKQIAAGMPESFGNQMKESLDSISNNKSFENMATATDMVGKSIQSIENRIVGLNEKLKTNLDLVEAERRVAGDTQDIFATANAKAKRNQDMMAKHRAMLIKGAQSDNKQIADEAERGLTLLKQHQSAQERQRHVSAEVTEADKSLRSVENNLVRQTSELHNVSAQFAIIKSTYAEWTGKQEKILSLEREYRDELEKNLATLEKQKDVDRETLLKARNDLAEANFRLQNPHEIKAWAEIQENAIEPLQDKLERVEIEYNRIAKNAGLADGRLRKAAANVKQGAKDYELWNNAADAAVEGIVESFGKVKDALVTENIEKSRAETEKLGLQMQKTSDVMTKALSGLSEKMGEPITRAREVVQSVSSEVEEVSRKISRGMFEAMNSSSAANSNIVGIRVFISELETADEVSKKYAQSIKTAMNSPLAPMKNIGTKMQENIEAYKDGISTLQDYEKQAEATAKEIEKLKKEYESQQKSISRVSKSLQNEEENLLRYEQQRNDILGRASTAYNTVSSMLAKAGDKQAQQILKNGKPEEGTIRQIEELKARLSDIVTSVQFTPEQLKGFEELNRKIEASKERASNLRKEIEQIDASRLETGTKIQRKETESDNLRGAASHVRDSLKEQSKELEKNQDTVSKYSSVAGIFSGISQAINLATGSMKAFTAACMSNPIVAILAVIIKLVQVVTSQLKQGFERLTSIVKKAGNALKRVFKPAIDITIKAVKNLTKSLVSFASNTVTKTLSKPFELIKKGLKSVESLLSMLKTRIKRRLVSEMFEDLTGTLGTMAEQRDEFNSSMSSMITSLRVLGAQIIAVAQPILEMLAPALELVSRLLTGIADKVAQFTARLNGQQEYFKASDGVYDFAEAMKSASGDTDKATKSAKAYENTVMGFDQLNKLNGKNDNSSASKSTALTNPVNLKKALTQATALNKLADKIRRAFKNKDFKNAGKYVAEAVNDAFSWLDKVAGWEKNADKIKEFMGGVIDFINGFIEGLDPQVIGHAIGDVLNSVIESIKMLTDPETGVNFEQLGLRLGQILQNAVKTINWYDAGAAFMQTIQAFVRTAVGFLETPGLFEDIGTAFKNALRGAIDSFRPEDWSDMLAGVVNGMSDFMVNAFSEKDATDAGEKLADSINMTWEKIDKEQLSSGIANFIRSISALALSLLKNTDWGNILGDFIVTLSDTITKLFTDEEGLVQVFEDPSGMIKIFDKPSDENDLFKSAEEKGKSFGNAISDGFNAFVDKIQSNKDKIVNSVVMSIKAIMSAIGTVLTTSDWAELLATLINGFFEGIGKLFEDSDKAKQFGVDLSVQIKKFFDSLDAEKIATGINNFTDSMNAFIDGLFDSETMASIEKKLGEVFSLIDWAGIIELSWNLSNAGITTRLAGLMAGSIKSAIEQSLPGYDTEIGKISYKSVGNLAISGLSPITGAINQTIDVGKFLFSKVQGFFANGGDVGDGQLFIANEHGAEAITRGDGGRTVITNNQQMVQAVSSGVRSAVLEAIRMSSGSNNNGNSGDIVLYVDSEELARASLRGQRSLDKRLNPVIQFA